MAASVYQAREREVTSIPIAEVFRDGKFDLLPEVQGKGYFDIRFQRDRLQIKAGHFVGLIPLNDRVFLQVAPKMPIANLLTILATVSDEVVELAVLQREYQAAPTAPTQILEAMALAFVSALQRVERVGILKSYEPFESIGPSLKGQLRFGESLQRFWNRGTRHAAVCEYHDLTADLPQNRFLRYACHVLLVHNRATGALARSAPVLADFDELFSRAGVELRHPQSGDVTSRSDSPAYSRALRLAQLIVKGQGVELPAGGSDVELPSFLVNMETVFEQYVRHVLAKRLVGVTVLDGNKEGQKPLFDDREDPPACPDVVVQRTPGDWPLVAEVKYKTFEGRDDKEQVLAYALTYRCNRVLIVMPAEAAADVGLSTVGRVQAIEILRYRINLDAPDLDVEEQTMTAAVQSLL